MSGPFPISIPPFSGLTYISSTQLTGLVSAVGLPATPPSNATIAALSIEGGNARWGTAGALPTPSTGTPLWGTTGAIMLAKSMFSSIRFINMTGSTAIINIDYYA